MCLVSCGKQETELNGEIFIATNGRENIKLGAVEISLIPEKDIKPFIDSKANEDEIKRAKEEYEKIKQKSVDSSARFERAEKKYREQKVSLELNTADSVEEFAKGFETLNDMRWSSSEIAETRKQAASDSFTATASLQRLNELTGAERYFTDIPSAIIKTTSNSDGKFSLKIAENGKYALAARTQRIVGDKVEMYYWLIWIEADGMPKSIILSNNNLITGDSLDSLVKIIEYAE